MIGPNLCVGGGPAPSIPNRRDVGEVGAVHSVRLARNATSSPQYVGCRDSACEIYKCAVYWCEHAISQSSPDKAHTIVVPSNGGADTYIPSGIYLLYALVIACTILYMHSAYKHVHVRHYTY